MAEARPRIADWPRLKALFQGALEQPVAAREQWLRAATGGDLNLLHEVQGLVDAHEAAGDFLVEPITVELAELLGPAEAGADAPSVEADSIPPQFHAGGRVGAYVILEEIGRGGMGVVYLAEDQRLARRVALKSLPSAAAADPAFRERLRREARAAATISHPGVAVVYALEEIDDQLLIVSEYVPGRTLRAAIADGPIAVADAIVIAADIARALAAAHDAGVVHRDLKPENVLLVGELGTRPSTGARGAGSVVDGRNPERGAVKVVDFGIAYVEGLDATRLTREGGIIGTPAYMAPEQLAGGPVDARVDIYAAGVLIAEMVKGRPAWLSAVIERCLQHDPDARFQSARELAAALEALHSQPPARTGERSTRNHAHWWWEFHQAMAALTYWMMVPAAWQARGVIGGSTGRALFIVTLAAVIVAANLRLHLWFTSRFYPRELAWLRARVARWIGAADWVYALALIGAALLLGDEQSPLAVLLLSFGIGSGVAFLFIEPATARAAFRGPAS